MPAFLMLFALLLAGCSSREPLPLVHYPQDITPFISQAKSLPSLNKDVQKSFNKKYFSPWEKSTLSYTQEEVTWAWRAYKPENGYVGETRQPRLAQWFNALFHEANFSAFNTVKKKAITLTNSALRNFPTHKPLFKDFAIAGEGYPFDYAQNSRIALMQPLFISHYSHDGAWALVQSAFSVGWIPTSDIASIDETLIHTLKNAAKLVIIQDKTPLYSNTQEFVSYAKTGTLLPLHVSLDGFYESYRVIKGVKGEALLQPLRVSTQYAKEWPLVLDQENLRTISESVLGEPYGWGGLFDNRDCSAMTKDFFAPFGLWLPRNSAAQRQTGHYVDLKDMDHERKETMIKTYGIPFLTLLYLQGHIMLYAGIQEDRVMVIHNTWGVKTLHEGKEGRALIGKAILSDLYLGENEPNVVKKSQLIAKVQGMSVLVNKHPLLKAYPEAIHRITNNHVLFHDGTILTYDDQQIKTTQETTENADIEDQLSLDYPALTPLSIPVDDPGRIRNDALFKKLYGQSKEEIAKNLVEVTWLRSHGAKQLRFNTQHGAAKALQAVSDELDTLDEHLIRYVNDPSGTFNYRFIAGTKRLSMHSYGIAIDINTKTGDYWRWSKSGEYTNKIPEKIVHIFEKHGFVWGGRWHHFDTLHFEYRPELVLP